MASLDFLFTPKSIALIGASSGENALSGIVLGNLARFKGRVYPVNPNYKVVLGLACYPSVRDLPEPVDLSVIMCPASEIPTIVREHKGRARCVLVVSAGFAETGESALQQELLNAGREAGVRILGPNCLGIYNPTRRLDTLFLPPGGLRRPKAGNVAVLSQSGAILICLLDALSVMGTGVSRAVNYGNAADLDVPEIFDFLAHDRETEVVISYLESVGDGREFIAAARRLADRKPLLLLKGGKYGSGQGAAFSHTGRLAGSYEVFNSILCQFGMREAGDFDALLDAAQALSCRKPAPGERVCIVTNAGGAGVLAADECFRQGLLTPPLPETLQTRLHRSFPPFYTVANPIDLTGQVHDEDYRTALAMVHNQYDGICVIALTGVTGITLRLASILREFASTGKPLVVHVAQGGVSGKLIPLLRKGRIPVYPSPERAVRGLRALMGGEK